MALRGYRPILEIMFGDFIALGFDQIVNGIAKFRAMFDEQVPCRSSCARRWAAAAATARRTARRWRSCCSASRASRSSRRASATTCARCCTPRSRTTTRLLHREQAHVRAAAPAARWTGAVGELRCRETDGRYPALTFSGNDFGGGDATIVTYGGMLPIVLDAVARADRRGGGLHARWSRSAACARSTSSRCSSR